jgi:hypothetical protein
LFFDRELSPEMEAGDITLFDGDVRDSPSGWWGDNELTFDFRLGQEENLLHSAISLIDGDVGVGVAVGV